MDKKFMKPQTTVLDHSSITKECVETQLKTMQLGYISHCFIVKGLEEDFDMFYEMNFKSFTEEIMATAEAHVLKYELDPNYSQSKVMKDASTDVKQCFQGLIMIKGKVEVLGSENAKAETMKRNISWLKNLTVEMEAEVAEGAAPVSKPETKTVHMADQPDPVNVPVTDDADPGSPMPTTTSGEQTDQ